MTSFSRAYSQILTFTLLAFLPILLLGQGQSKEEIYIDSLNKVAGEIGYSAPYQQINIAENAQKIALATNYLFGHYEAILNIGIAYLNLGDFEKALQYIQEANLLADELGDTKIRAEAIYFLGNVHNYLKNFKKSMECFEEALALSQLLENDPRQGIVLNSIGNIFYQQGDFKQAEKYYKQASLFFEKENHEKYINSVLVNLGNIKYEQGDFQQSIHYYQQAYEQSKKRGKEKAAIIANLNLGWCYRELKQYDKALFYFNNAVEHAKKYHFSHVLFDAYKDLADTYEKMENDQMELRYFKLYSTLRDSIFNLEKNETITQLQVEYETIKQEKEIIESKQNNFLLQQQQIKNSYIIIGVTTVLFFLILAMALFWRQKKATHLSWTKQLENEQRANKQLEGKLNAQQTDLTNLVLDIQQKNEFLIQMYETLKVISEKTDFVAKNEKIRSLLIAIQNFIKVNKSKEELYLNIEKVNSVFQEKLNQFTPSLTAKEKQLCSYIRLNLNNKDIAEIKNISLKSVEMARYRLRKKLPVTKDADLYQFIQNL